MHMRRRSGSVGATGRTSTPATGTQSRHQSIVEAAEAHFDKNTIIICINVIILAVLVGLLYVVASSAKTVSDTVTGGSSADK